MRRFWMLPLACAVLAAQTEESPQLARARAEIESLRGLVESGAAPRARLEAAELDLADAVDGDYLRRTLYGPFLTEEDSGEMLAVAKRRLERQKERLTAAKNLVEEGVAGRLTLTEPLQRVDLARKELDLAESRALLVREIASMARLEMQALEESQAKAAAPQSSGLVAERFEGVANLGALEFKQLLNSYEGRFSKALPVSAQGGTALHRAMGFDHSNRVDVALHPDQPEGKWLRQYLEFRRVPYIAFRHSVKGQATAAHIHIGPPSVRIARTSSGGGE